MGNVMTKIIRVLDKDRGYTMVRNDIFRDKNISLKGKGLYCLLWSLPDDWDVTIEGLAALSKDARDGVRAAVVELEEAKYLVRYRDRNDDGSLSGTVYELYQKPMTEIPSQVPMTDFPTLANPTQLNTDVVISNREMNKRKKEDSKRIYGAYKHVRLTDDEWGKLNARFPDATTRITKLDNYIESTGKTYRNHYQTILNWAEMDEERKNAPRPGSAISEAEKFRKIAEGFRNGPSRNS